MEHFIADLAKAVEAIEGRLARLPVSDTWATRVQVAEVAAVRTSVYVEDELWFAGADGAAEASGLSGSGIAAKSGHTVSVVRLRAANSKAEAPVVVFNHANGKCRHLSGNFPPLLRSRNEALMLAAGLTAGLAAAAMAALAGILPAVFENAPGPILYVVVAAPFLGFAVAVNTVSRRRKRLRRALEDHCAEIEAALATGETPPPATITLTAPDSLPCPARR